MDWRIIVGFAFLFIPVIIFITSAYLTTTSPRNTEIEYPYVITADPSTLSQDKQSSIIYEKLDSSIVETAIMTVITPGGSITQSPIKTGVTYTFPKDFNISETIPGTYELIISSESPNSKKLLDKTVNMTSFNPLAVNTNGNEIAILLFMAGAIPTFWNYFQDLSSKQTLQKERKLTYTQNNLTTLYDFINSCKLVSRKKRLLDSRNDNIIEDFILSLLLLKCYHTKFNHYYLDNFKMEGFLASLEKLIMKQRDELLGMTTFSQKFKDRQVSFYIEEASRQGKLDPDPLKDIKFHEAFLIYVDGIESRLKDNQPKNLLNQFALNCDLYSHEFEKEINSILSISYSNEKDVKDSIKASESFYTEEMRTHVKYLRDTVFCDLKESNQFPVLWKGNVSVKDDSHPLSKYS